LKRKWKRLVHQTILDLGLGKGRKCGTSGIEETACSKKKNLRTHDTQDQEEKSRERCPSRGGENFQKLWTLVVHKKKLGKRTSRKSLYLERRLPGKQKRGTLTKEERRGL